MRYVDDAAAAGDDVSRGAGDEGGLTPEELGRESAYEGATEMGRRVDRGAEADTEQGRERADDRDVAGSSPDSELDENREDQDTAGRGRRDAGAAQTGWDSRAREAGAASEPAREARKFAASSLSAEAELLAAQAEASILDKEVEQLKSERQELVEQMARRQADFDNYRKRMERERAETYNRVVGEVARHLLPVVDNLRRAVLAEASSEAGESQEFRNFLHGVELISKQLNGVLDSLGIETVETVGSRFDPHVHEAVATEQTDEFEPETVTHEIQRGYRLGERLLRPALVKVATR